MKYRQHTEDFIVEEIAKHKILEFGRYKLFHLYKEGKDTLSILKMISTKNKIPFQDIGVAGLKDTHAKTVQYISIPKKYDIKDKFVEFLGFINSPIKTGDLIGNKFTITVNEISKSELNDMYNYSENMHQGVINYFDSQRFGSVIDGKFIAKQLIRKNYEDAMKYYLMNSVPSESLDIQVDKKAIKNSWGTFDCEIKTPLLKRIIDDYKKTGKWILAFKLIPANLRALFISAYQSYIWNECIKELLLDKKYLREVKYSIGTLFLPANNESIPKAFPTVSHKMVLKDYERKIVEKVLDKEGLELSQFNIRQTGNFFKSNDRNVIVFPKDFKIDEPIKTEKGYSVTLEFMLPKGSYATIVLKQLFGK